MATNLISVGTTAASSAEFVLATGESSAVGVKSATVGCKVLVELKDDAGGFTVVDELNYSKQAGALTFPGTYRLTRAAGAGSCGAFRA